MAAHGTPESRKAYREKHREELRRKSLEYYYKHRQHYIEEHRKYREQNKTKIGEYQSRPEVKERNRASAKRFREQNKEYCKQKDREYFQKNKHWLIPLNTERARRWIEAHPEEYKESLKWRYQKERENRKQRILFKKKRVLLNFKPRTGKCSLCGATDKLTHIHHIKYHDKDPLKDTIEICFSCHLREHHRMKKTGGIE